MTELQASRTLVKSPPELWAECSDAASLARHLGRFGGIQITRLEPETAVAWEGEKARGTVRIEPAGWGTRVILTAEEVSEAPSPPEEPAEMAAGSAPTLEAESPPPRRRRFARLFARRRAPEPPPEPVAVDPPEPEVTEPEPEPVPPPDASGTEAALTAALESLGQAHHRPYSRG